MIISIVGPTAVGKTKLSESLAKKCSGIIINADAVQMYKKLNIGSAKPVKDEMEDVPHFLFDEKDVTDDYTVADFQKEVRVLFEKYKDRNIILVGGSGLYVSAALYDYEFALEENTPLNYEKYSNEELYNMVKLKFPDYKEHSNNRQRLLSKLKKTTNGSNANKLLYNVKFVGLTTNRDVLYDKINNRVLDMIDKGLINEVQSLSMYRSKSRVLNSAIGYKEVFKYLDNTISKEDMISDIQRNSRRYAKRQYTWFNNKMDVKWFNTDYNDFDKTIKEVINYLDL